MRVEQARAVNAGALFNQCFSICVGDSSLQTKQDLKSLVLRLAVVTWSRWCVPTLHDWEMTWEILCIHLKNPCSQLFRDCSFIWTQLNKTHTHTHTVPLSCRSVGMLAGAGKQAGTYHPMHILPTSGRWGSQAQGYLPSSSHLRSTKGRMPLPGHITAQFTSGTCVCPHVWIVIYWEAQTNQLDV